MAVLKNEKNKLNSYYTIELLGKSYILNVSYINSNKIQVIQKKNDIFLILPTKYMVKDNREIINKTIMNLYEEKANIEIENAMELARHSLGFAPEDYVIKRMNGVYCKVAKKVIYINPDIVKFSKDIIIETILQAYCKIQYRQGSKNYKQLLVNVINNYEDNKKVLTYAS